MDQKLEAHKINKPFQLLAAWLVGLTIINASFLTTASIIADPPWIRVALIVAAICNVPIFIICIFMLQTKFRPEMQDDTFYSEHLKTKTNSITGKSEVYNQEVLGLRSEMREVVKINNKLNEMITELKEQILVGSQSDNFMKTNDQYLGSIGDQIIEKEDSWDDIRIEINNLMPQYNNIKQHLKENGIKISNTFGKNSIDKPIPKKFVLSIGLNIPMKNIQKMITLLKDYGLESIDYVDYEQDIYDECISTFYIGSYAYEDEKTDLIVLDDNLLKTILDPDIEEDIFFETLGVYEWET